MLKKKSFYIGTLVLGICLLIIALLLFFIIGEELKSITGVCLGIGSGLSGMSIANLLMKRIESKNPVMRKQNEIDYNDERNAFIRYKAKSKVANIMKWCIIGIAYITILINTHLWLTLVIVGVFVLQSILVVYFTNKYQKEI